MSYEMHKYNPYIINKNSLIMSYKIHEDSPNIINKKLFDNVLKERRDTIRTYSTGVSINISHDDYQK